MPRVAFDMHTVLPAERILAMLTDFSERRPALWPTLAPELYEVYDVSATSADVKEGSLKPILIWERDHYDWSIPGRMRWTVRESNYCTCGSFVEATIRHAADGGTSVHVEWNRTGVGLKGKALIALVVLSRGAIIRRKVFKAAFDRAVQKISRQ